MFWCVSCKRGKGGSLRNTVSEPRGKRSRQREDTASRAWPLQGWGKGLFRRRWEFPVTASATLWVREAIRN